MHRMVAHTQSYAGPDHTMGGPQPTGDGPTLERPVGQIRVLQRQGQELREKEES